MKGTAVNTLGYTGIVKLSQYINGKKFTIAEVHNKGGQPLFNFLIDCLMGDYSIADIDRPTKIRLLRKNDDDPIGYSELENTGPIHIQAKPEKIYSTNEGIVRYSFIIPQEYFSAGRFDAIGLYPNSTTNIYDYAALCEIKDSSAWAISVTSVLVLDWELHISN